ncbi:hypothetical protein A2V49_01685 [candidate division WWE3 bacterium RBG_19FT_COMBO_34_6]|uniref:5'-3' exonuclease domain-containing protein n=1 Tax=candidate division WWE3 bacterium RBG_19FT_COMBO_34_6 TaxID=1802612 RepID=A0A1F4UK01_UNCKA|nr:MAG: hypothetical protein A2V49_01685 [candidate division WWE3 bacterium RBG_19FT_COMBO_34_6]
MKKLLLIDTFNFLHRAYHALPITLTNSQGEPTNAVYGVASMLLSVTDLIKPDYTVAALDDIAPTFRVEEFTGYKAHRKPMEEELSSQIPKMFEILDCFGIKKISLPGYEADDVIGTLVSKFTGRDLQIIIVSNDQDMWQLIGVNSLVLNPDTKGNASWIGQKEALARFGFDPVYIPQYKALRGDPSDNIPGVYGIGDVTAKKLIIEYKTIDEIYKNIDKISPDKLREKLLNNYEQAIMSRGLANIIKDAPVNVDLEECKYLGNHTDAIKDVLTKYNFKSLLKRIGALDDKKISNVSKDQMELF